MTCNDVFWSGIIIGILATPMFTFVRFLLVCLFGKKYCVKVIIKYCGMTIDYSYGFRAWNKNGAILKALNAYVYSGIRDLDEIISIKCNVVD